MVRLPVTINKSSSLQCLVQSQLTALYLRKGRKTSPQIGKHIGKLLDSKLVTLIKSAWGFLKYLGFSMHPACWAQLSQRHFLWVPCYHSEMFSHFLNCLTLLDVSGFNGSEYNRRESKVGRGYVCPVAAACVGLEGALCAAKRDGGRRGVLKHPTETNTAI